MTGSEYGQSRYSTPVKIVNGGQPGGVATLDQDGKLPSEQLPGDLDAIVSDCVDDYMEDHPIEDVVADWLEDHPEATTTVEDGAITVDKLASDTLALIGSTKLIATASGTTAQTVSDAWPDATLKSAALYGKSIQSGTPAPDSPVPVQVVGGRNLFSTEECEQWFTTRCSVTADSDAITLTASGTDCYIGRYGTTGTVLDWGNVLVEALPSTTYTITIGPAFDKNFIVLLDASYTVVRVYANTTVGNRFTFTTTADTAYISLRIGVSNSVNGGVYSGTIQLETGTRATPYVPYGYIDLLIGETAVPIDLQGNTLAILPDGTRDVLHVDNVGNVTIEQNVGYIASYNGESVGNVYISTTGALTTGASVYYKLTMPTTTSLGTITLPELTQTCELAIYASLDPQWAIQYEQDPNAVISTLEASIAPIEGGTASTNYSVGAYFVHGNQLYRVTSAIATGEMITPGTNCTATTVMAEIVRLTA